MTSQTTHFIRFSRSLFLDHTTTFTFIHRKINVCYIVQIDESVTSAAAGEAAFSSYTTHTITLSEFLRPLHYSTRRSGRFYSRSPLCVTALPVDDNTSRYTIHLIDINVVVHVLHQWRRKASRDSKKQVRAD